MRLPLTVLCDEYIILLDTIVANKLLLLFHIDVVSYLSLIIHVVEQCQFYFVLIFFMVHRSV